MKCISLLTMNELKCPQKSYVENYTIEGGVVEREKESVCVN